MEILLSWLIDNTLVLFFRLFLLPISPSPRDRTLLLLFTPSLPIAQRKACGGDSVLVAIPLPSRKYFLPPSRFSSRLRKNLFKAASSPSREAQRDPGNNILTIEPSLPTISGDNMQDCKLSKRCNQEQM